MIAIKDIYGNVLVEFKENSLENALLNLMDLRNADLRGMNLSNADLSFSDLSGANLCGTNLLWADLTGTILDDIITDSETLIPSLCHHLACC